MTIFQAIVNSSLNYPNYLIKRGDNARHYPQVENFPHHIHIKDEAIVIPGRKMNILEFIDLVEREIKILPEQ